MECRRNDPGKPASFPGSQIASPAARPGRSNGTVSDSPRVTRFRGKTTPDSPRVMPETACNSWSWKWWPGTESNHRHADFQDNGEPGSVRASRRFATNFLGADRTALADRAHTEPGWRAPSEPRTKLKKRKGGGASRPSSHRTGGRPVLSG